jgi:predicted CXXCH cytochrome family protein
VHALIHLYKDRLALLIAALSAASSSGTASDQTYLQPEKPTSEVFSCISSGCHSSITEPRVIHAPVAESQCLNCHEYAVPEEHLFVLSKPNNELCIDCHKPSHLDRVVHKPVADGDCLSCHDPHGSEFPTILRKDPARGLCLDCHKEDYSEHKFIHGPVAIGACVVCHDSHSSSYEGLLIDNPDRLCLDCHEDLKPEGVTARRQHKPMEDGCIACHNPHASDEKFQLNMSVPQLCMKCHDGFKEMFETAPVKHGPTQDQGGCTACHNPHFSVLPKLQKDTQPELCLKCHNKPLKAADGRMLVNMEALLKENPDHHGPIREGACTMCHHPHASSEKNLLLQAYPPEFYAPFSEERYKLCFSCHQIDLVTNDKGAGITQFRQGDVNLHWLHVNQEKGRTCRACHEVHASKRPAHIRESVPFGTSGWMLDLNFEKTLTGGSCLPGCHKTKAYDRINPVENEIKVPQSILDANK